MFGVQLWLVTINFLFELECLLSDHQGERVGLYLVRKVASSLTCRQRNRATEAVLFSEDQMGQMPYAGGTSSL